MRLERLRDGPDVAREQERALLGALILEPGMVRLAARHRPPAWFTDEKNLVVMRALFCVSSRPDEVDTDAVLETLEVHGALAEVGGRGAVEALVAPRPDLDVARGELAKLRAQLVPVEDETIVLFARTVLGGQLAADDDLLGPQ